ncbi:MAG: polynucleotide kinase-phosphatase [Cyanobacteria bacterium J06639_1]
MKITIPELAIVVLIGASGSGKSTFARQHFLPTEVISSDVCRGLVSDDTTNQDATADAFDVLHYIAAKRLAAGRLTVIDATSTRPEDRMSLIRLAREYHCFAVAIALNLPAEVCLARNQQRPDRQFGSHVVYNHVQNIRRSRRTLKKEGFRYIYELTSEAEIDAVEIERQPLWTNRKSDRGPFDIIGDIHGCCDELDRLLHELGYREIETNSETPFWSQFPTFAHPEGRRAIFLGDLVDRGSRILDVVGRARNMVAAGSAICIPGNHENKLVRKLDGKNVKINHGLEQTLAEIDAIEGDRRSDAIHELREFLGKLVSHYVLDDGKLVVAHAGMKAEYQGRSSGRVRSFALYGETTGEMDEFGLPVRYNWAAEYRGKSTVVYGHTPVPEAEWSNNTINVDTGCVFGGKLTALRYPEKELVSIPAARVYCEPVKPLVPVEPETQPSAQQQFDDVLNVQDVLGKRRIETRLQKVVTIREANAIAALEVMSRFAVHPKWLIYLPPTMSPVATSDRPGLLEHPQEAFGYYRDRHIDTVICEEKHMGSRAIAIVCRDEEVVQKRFGLTDAGIGICYTRTGRRFFGDRQLESEFLARLQQALTQTKFWDALDTDWVCLDCELMPWSAKARALLQEQYAPVGAAARQGLSAAIASLQKARDRGVDVGDLVERYETRSQLAQNYIEAYQQYCWNAKAIGDFKLAPFHVLATEGAVHADKDHLWHMEQVARACEGDRDLLLATQHRKISLNDSESCAAGIRWWESLVENGGEGMVVKPLAFYERTPSKLIQPAVKCRGSEYLRIIYGPEYTQPEHLDRLRKRGLSAKRSLALREFALGIEALERFIRREPLRRVHECVFGVLALESEPVDPRL